MGESQHLASPLPSPSTTAIGARSCLLTSSRLRGTTLELTPMSFWKSQESLCTPTGLAQGATCQRRPTLPKKKMWHEKSVALFCVTWQSCLKESPALICPGGPHGHAICYISKVQIVLHSYCAYLDRHL